MEESAGIHAKEKTKGLSEALGSKLRYFEEVREVLAAFRAPFKAGCVATQHPSAFYLAPVPTVAVGCSETS